MIMRPYNIDQQTLAERLKRARNLAGITQANAAKALNMSRTTLVAMEKGDRPVKKTELLKIAELYGETASRLTRPSALQAEFNVDFRSSLDSRTDKEALEAVKILQRLSTGFVELEARLGKPQKWSYPPVQRIYAKGMDEQAEDLAIFTRGLLGVGNAPIEDLITLLEEGLGFRIFLHPLPSKISGLFAFTEELGPCVVLNIKHPRSRCIWTLAHELGHFLTTRYETGLVLLGQSTVETFVDRFAAAFLLPGAVMRREFNQCKEQYSGRFTTRHLIRLAYRHHVSLEAIVRRFEKLKLLKQGTYESLRDKGLNFKHAEEVLGRPFERVQSRISRFCTVVIEGYNKGILSEGQAAEFLAVDRVDFREMVHEFGEGVDLELE